MSSQWGLQDESIVKKKNQKKKTLSMQVLELSYLKQKWQKKVSFFFVVVGSLNFISGLD